MMIDDDDDDGNQDQDDNLFTQHFRIAKNLKDV